MPDAAAGAAIRQVIERQLAAFRADDGETAFAFASPLIRSQFGTADAFMRMVRTGYPSVYRARQVQFRALAVISGRLVQQVALVGPDGKAGLALYFMEAQADGAWRIDGCTLLDLGEEAA
ncbi:MAG: DUF4864 domain-containing protein [Alphaproteobacteria bacterium]|nr:DUF4864 domain-containing protein [Alphaproteobacteria bacterium]